MHPNGYLEIPIEFPLVARALEGPTKQITILPVGSDQGTDFSSIVQLHPTHPLSYHRMITNDPKPIDPFSDDLEQQRKGALLDDPALDPYEPERGRWKVPVMILLALLAIGGLWWATREDSEHGNTTPQPLVIEPASQGVSTGDSHKAKVDKFGSKVVPQKTAARRLTINRKKIAVGIIAAITLLALCGYAAWMQLQSAEKQIETPTESEGMFGWLFGWKAVVVAVPVVIILAWLWSRREKDGSKDQPTPGMAAETGPKTTESEEQKEKEIEQPKVITIKSSEETILKRKADINLEVTPIAAPQPFTDIKHTWTTVRAAKDIISLKGRLGAQPTNDGLKITVEENNIQTIEGFAKMSIYDKLGWCLNAKYSLLSEDWKKLDTSDKDKAEAKNDLVHDILGLTQEFSKITTKQHQCPAQSGEIVTKPFYYFGAKKLGTLNRKYRENCKYIYCRYDGVHDTLVGLHISKKQLMVQQQYFDLQHLHKLRPFFILAVKMRDRQLDPEGTTEDLVIPLVNDILQHLPLNVLFVIKSEMASYKGGRRMVHPASHFG